MLSFHVLGITSGTLSRDILTKILKAFLISSSSHIQPIHHVSILTVVGDLCKLRIIHLYNTHVSVGDHFLKSLLDCRQCKAYLFNTRFIH
jgi:hypothetical protein